jgi:hypothetical protein
MFDKTIRAGWFFTPILLALSSPVNASEQLRFQVYLGDKPIGEHSFRNGPKDQRPLGNAVHMADKVRLQDHLSRR